MDTNEEIYKQNFELSIRNKTLSILRSLYAITMSSLEVQEVSQRIVDTIAKELGFTAVLVSLIDESTRQLFTAAITQSPTIIQAIQLTGKPLNELVIPMDFPDNLIVNAIKSNQRQITSNLLDIVDPLVSQATADEMENITGIKTIIIFPLVLGNKKIGALTVGLPKKVDDLSRAEKETLDQLIDVVAIAIDRAQLHQRLKLLDKLKDDFVSVASHELRTPMTAIRSYTWMALNKSTSLDEKTRDYLSKVYTSTERLIHLVNEMLDVSRIESGRVRLKPESVNLVQLAQDVQTEFQARSQEQNLNIIINAPKSLPEVKADREKIHQVFENLVGNAFKFTPPGGTVTITLSNTEKNIQIAISDTGHGISTEDLPKLFAKFGMLENTLTPISGSGTGLGLFICKQYIELHGGQIWADSTLGQGSTFTFTLPRA